MISGRRATAVLLLLLGLACALALAAAAPADAANRRISIGGYKWSDPDIHIDKGEHVTWYWVGPDTLHSITGIPPEAKGLDSDPDRSQPLHTVGDKFTLEFDKPGTYKFRCKIHSTVRGTITVSDTPGDPNSEPDPEPKPDYDTKAPKLTNVYLAKTNLGRRGTNLRYSTNEPTRVEVDYYRLRGRRGRKFIGWAAWKRGHVGYNSVRFGTRRRHFKPEPGRYVAEVTGTDRYANTSRVTRLKFKIFPRHRRKR